MADAQSIHSTPQWAVDLAKLFESRLFVLFITEPSRKKKLASLTKRDIKLISEELEESGWQSLYLVEEEAFEKEVKTSLHYEEGPVFETAIEFIKNYGIQLLVIKNGEAAKKFAGTSPIPVFVA